MTPTLEQTKDLVRKHFPPEMKDRSGDELFNHISRVVEGVSDYPEDVQHCAWLHDLVEDTKVTIEDLRELGYSEEILHSVWLLTHNKKEMDYSEYIDRICASGDHRAIYVKISDQMDNLDKRRWLRLDRYVANALRKRYAGVWDKLMAAAMELEHAKT